MARTNLIQRIATGVRSITRGWQGYGIHGAGSQGGLTQGGLVNNQTGLGTPLDHTEGSFFVPTLFNNEYQLETAYNQSWACRNFINIPVDDSFIRWRRFKSDDENISLTMREQEQRHDLKGCLSQSMKCGRLHGTGLLWIRTREAAPHTPLQMEKLKPGDLIGFTPITRYEANVFKYDLDPMSPNYQKPLWYEIYLDYGQHFLVHHSRILRFDGIKPLSITGFSSYYDRDWGVSELVPAITAILQDSSMMGNIAHLTFEASLPVIKLEGLKAAMASRRLDPTEANPDTRVEKFNQMRSNMRTTVIDKNDEFTREAVQFGGLKDILNLSHERLAAMAGIQAARFLGKPPVGMNATGESDMVNHAMTVNARQELTLTMPLKTIDQILALDAGLLEPPEYEWIPLVDLSKIDEATAARLKAEALEKMVNINIIGDSEARAALDGDPVFGDIPEERPDDLEIELQMEADMQNAALTGMMEKAKGNEEEEDDDDQEQEES